MTAVGDPGYEKRYDLNADKKVNIIDIVLLRPVIMTTCP